MRTARLDADAEQAPLELLLVDVFVVPVWLEEALAVASVDPEEEPVFVPEVCVAVFELLDAPLVAVLEAFEVSLADFEFAVVGPGPALVGLLGGSTLLGESEPFVFGFGLPRPGLPLPMRGSKTTSGWSA